MQEGEKPIFTDPSKCLEELKWFYMDERYVPPDYWEELKKSLLSETMDSIAELGEDIGLLAKLRANTTDIDALGTIAKLIDLNLSMIRGYQDELASQRKAYELD